VDVKRLAASLAVAGRDNGFGIKARRKIVLAAAGSYRTAMRGFAEQPFLSGDGDEPLFLQAKEAQPSVLAAHCGRSQYASQGERVVAGQHLMQAESDIFLGWTRVPGLDKIDRDFYVRQLKDWKLSAPVEQMIPSGMRVYAGLCGWTLARAHARSGDRVALAAYLGGSDAFDQAIADFAETYADQNERDYAALQAAVKDGRAEAATEI